MKKKRKNFTLIELLVVISVIAILTGLLLPALHSARKKGQSIACTGKLKQFGTILMMYASDSGDLLPCSNGMGYADTWAHKLLRGSYVKAYTGADKLNAGFPGIPGKGGFPSNYPGTDKGLFACPSVTDADITSTATARSYACAYGSPCAVLGHGAEGGLRISKIKRSTLVFLYDGAEIRNTGYVAGGMAFAPYMAAVWPSSVPGPMPAWLSVRHSGRPNILFADGHAGSLNWYALRNNTEKCNYFACNTGWAYSR